VLKRAGRGVPLLLIAACAFLVSACATTLPAIDETLGAAETFQRAQDAADRGDLEVALQYYTLFRKNHPDDRDRGAWASYEIAFLYHRMGRDDTALSLFNELLALYAKEGDALPPGPRILAEKLAALIGGNANKAP